MTGNRVFEDMPSVTMPPPGVARRNHWLTWASLALVLLLGGYFRTVNLFGWDEPSSRLHPDERFMVMVANSVRVPSSLDEYLDSSRNPLNPRNNGHSLYVYGLLPQTLTRLTAVMLSPNQALPSMVPLKSTPDSQPAYRVRNPELDVPKLTLLQLLLNPAGRDLTDYYEIYKIGRAWSVLFDLGSIVVVFLLGRRLYDRRVGLLAALLLALSVLPIQLAHFFTVDAPTAFFTLLALYWAVRVAQRGGVGNYAALGLSIGAAMACRVTLATLGLVAMVAVIARLLGRADAPAGPFEADLPPLVSAPPRPFSELGLLALAGLLALLAFRILQPDAFIGSSPESPLLGNAAPAASPTTLDRLLHGRGLFDIRPEPRFVENLKEIRLIVSGEIDFPPSQQWANRTPFVFSLQNMIVWGMGLPLGVAAWAGWAVAGWQLLRRRTITHLLPWLWITFYFLWQGGQFVMTMRYYAVLYGLLALCAAWLLVGLYDRRFAAIALPRRFLRLPDHQFNLRWVPLAVVVLGTLAWAYAFTRIYTQPHSRITASRWIYAHIPPRATITHDVWDDPLPLNVDGHDASQYAGIEMTPYDEDEQAKYYGHFDAAGQYKPGFFDQLDQADYIVLSSNRVYGSAPRMPMRYPALTRYYQALFSGELGFKLVADIASYPQLFGIPIPDQAAEEAFSVYDHPRVLIFQKTPAYSRERAEQLIVGGVAWDEVYKLPTVQASRVPTALRLTEDQWPAYRSAGTWASLFDPANIGHRVPWLVWFIVLELIGLAVFPILFRLLPALPDRGFALARTLGLLVVAYGAWLLGSFRLMAFTPASVWLCTVLLIVAGAVVGWRSRAALLAFVRERRTALLSAEGLFLAAFFGFVIIRAFNPDLWHPARGGEKPMDLAFLTAVLKSGAFPPYDPWFAGGYINYYYFGFVLVGALIHLTGIVPTVAYNLAVPTIFALTALGAWGVAYNLVGDRRRSVGVALHHAAARHRSSLAGRIERRAILSGIVAALFVVLAGNLAQATWFLPGSADQADPGIPAQCQAFSSYAAQQQCRGRSEWAFWDASRVVGIALKDSTINEFPFFTFLFGDLHAHMIALPLALAALGLMVAIARSADRKPPANRRWFAGGAWFLTLGLLALVIGALRATNTWDYPTYLGLSVLTLGLGAWGRVRRGEAWPTAIGRWARAALLLALLSQFMFLPFIRSFATDYAGLERWSGPYTPLAGFLTINGVWLFILVSAALVLYRRARNRSGLWIVLMGALALLLTCVGLVLRANALFLLLPGMAGAAMLLIGLIQQQPAADRRNAQPPLDTLAPSRRWSPGGDADIPSDRFQVPGYSNLAVPLGPRRLAPAAPAGVSLATLLSIMWVLAALGVALLSEVAVAKGDIGRMNTVFKLGMQSWTLFAVTTAVAAVWLWQPGRRVRAIPADRFSIVRTWAWRSTVLLLIGAALVYPITATPARLADRFDPTIAPTLDGMAYMRSARWSENGKTFDLAEDAAAIDWMRANISGTPIVLEAQTGGYHWGGRVATYTGLPTLLGWPWHETQQRSVAQVEPVLQGRQELIRWLYTILSPDDTLQKLRLYGVEYVFVGQLERALYDPAGLAKFDVLAGQGRLQLVYASGATRIYRVPTSDQPPAVVTTARAIRPSSLPPSREPILDQPVNFLPAINEYAWNRLADSQVVAVVLWLLAGYALLILGLPLAILVFERWRAGGYAWARLIGLLLLGYAVWLPVSARLWLYNGLGLLLGLLIVLALNAAVIAWLGWRPEEQRSDETARRSAFGRGLRRLAAHVRGHWRQVLMVEGLFLGAFAFLTLLRALNPDLWQPIWGGEKPFEFGLLNAILRSPVMPPYDPFFSGGYINYYYYGLFLVSLPIKATGIAPAVAFNLVIPTLFALTAVGAFAVVFQLSGQARYGVVGAAFVALAGNLATVVPIGWSQGLAPVWQALQGGLPGFGARLGDWFVGPSRVITTPVTINEFPFWSFLFADLHPHLIALPMTILMIALAYQMYASWRAGARAPWPGIVGRWALAALTLGALAVTNSWDFPTYALLMGGALLGAAWQGGATVRAHADGVRLVRQLALAVAISGALAAAALLLYAPFFQHFQAMVRGIGPVRDGTPLDAYVLIYGLFLAVLVPVCFGAAWRVLRLRERRIGRRSGSVDQSPQALGIVAGGPVPTRLLSLGRGVLVVLGLLLTFAVVQGMLTFAASKPEQPSALRTIATVMAHIPAPGLRLWLGVLVLVGATLLLTRRLRPATWFIVWMATVGWAVSLGIEYVFIRDHLAGGEAYRMNTVFKFGLQIWVLLALAAAAALPLLMRGLRRAGAVAEGAGWAVVGWLCALSLAFPLVGVPSRLAYRFPDPGGPTLDGLAFMERAQYDWNGNQIDLRADGEAIRWLNQHITGTPVVLQSSLEFYRAYGVRIAANTGLPTVVSPLHENEQRDSQVVAERDADVERLYRTTDVAAALELLAKYRVDYVYVGPIERAAYGQAGVQKFDQMVGSYLSLAYSNPAVNIYKVNDAVFGFTTASLTSPAQPPVSPPDDQAALDALARQVAQDPTQAGPAFGLAQRYYALGRLDEAAAVLTEAARANPNDAPLHHLWGDILRDVGRFDEAEAAYRHAADIEPTAGNYNKLGAELIKMGQANKAEEALRKAITLDPREPDPYYHLGQVFEQQGRRDQAVAQYRQYLTLAPADGRYRQSAIEALERLK